MRDKYCLVTNATKDKGLKVTNEIANRIRNAGHECIVISDIDFKGDSAGILRGLEPVDATCKCCIVLGGDGTLIRTSRILCAGGVPVVGINLGMLGFLSVIEKNNIDKALDNILSGNYIVEDRMMLRADIPGQNAYKGIIALNDIVVTRSGRSRLISVAVKVNGVQAAAFLGDGVIVSTPTGSTGYNLSAGGPIVKPPARLMIITPICPHSFNSRSIVIDDGDRISLSINAKDGSNGENAVITVDGQDVLEMDSDDELVISCYEKTAKLVRFEDTSFFGVIDKKFGAGDNPVG
ncbi:MAG: NAD(+)/NADH kinase [Lachnospiraceae bacterium]|nr:NAD(+)/NADH kinase [Lachnospiraceae bacterium]